MKTFHLDQKNAMWADVLDKGEYTKNEDIHHQRAWQ